MNPILLFDLYGTLIEIETDENSESAFKFISKWLKAQGVNTTNCKLEFLFNSFTEKRRRLKKNNLGEYEITSIFYDIIKTICPTKRPRRMCECVARIYRVMITRYINLIEETYNLLELARESGYKTGIVANAQRFNAEAEMEMFNISRYVDFSIFSSDIGVKIPNPLLLSRAKEQFCGSAKEIYYITSSSKNNVESLICSSIKTINSIPNKGFSYKNKIFSASELIELIASSK